MKKFTLFMTLLLFVPGLSSAQCGCNCGDVNCDGRHNIGDGVYLLNYVFKGGPAPLDNDIECADWDYARKLTISDIYLSIMYAFMQIFPPEFCPPTAPPIAPEVDSSLTLYYTDWIWYGAGSGVIALTLNKEYETYVNGMSFPLRIRIDGEIPTIDSVVIEYGDLVGYTVYEDSGDVAIGVIPLFSGSSWITQQVALIHVSTQAAPGIGSVSIEWVNLTPVQAPTQDSSIIPALLNHYNNGVEPLLEPHCCVVPGDANMDGTPDVGDVVYIINCVFKDCLGHDCEKQIDVNCDGLWNLGDAVFLINYIFRGGPPPCCL